MDLTILPTLNAALNSLSAALLTGGYLLIRQRHVQAHRACMLAAFGTSSLFLVSYVVYHFQVGSVAFSGPEVIRIVYFSILVTHIVLAILILPMAIATLVQALRGNFERHRRIARWTLPAWLYVSVTGIIVYLMLYHL